MSGRGRGGGRGWYYKQLYGGRGKREHEDAEGGDSGHQAPQGAPADYDDEDDVVSETAGPRGSTRDLSKLFQRIDGKGYKAYKDVLGSWQHQDTPSFLLFIDHVQGDPYAAPSRFRVQVPASVACFPPDMWSSSTRRTALADYLTRRFADVVSAAGADIRAQSGGWGGNKGGDLSVDRPGQHVLQRSSVTIKDGMVEARFTVGLPARGRTVLGEWAARIVVNNLPGYVGQGLLYKSQDHGAVMRHIHCVEDTQALRDALEPLGLVAFVGDGSILPRASGASELPMPAAEAVPFQSPDSLAVTIKLPNRGVVRGMGVLRGVTLIVGGGFHGKTTMLKALELGVYNKVPADGRELVATDSSAVKIRAEDGRRVEGVDISPFINNLPYKKDTTDFRTPDASGSTSQAANIQEALECGSQVLLVDEDTSATNFMIRDMRMQMLVSSDKEPITPFISKIRALAARGVSCVLVIGGSGDYFDVADVVVCMEGYRAHDVTEAARKIASAMPAKGALWHAAELYGNVTPRTLVSVLPPGGTSRWDFKMTTRSVSSFQVGRDMDVNLTAVEQLVEVSQTRAIADSLTMLAGRLSSNKLRGKSLKQILAELEKEFDTQGLDVISPHRKFGNYARPRSFELAAALNRLRSCVMKQIR